MPYLFNSINLSQKQAIYTAKINNNIGEIYRILKCYDEAIIYYNLAVDLNKKLNYQATFGVVLSNLGYFEYCLGNYDKALIYLNESLTYLFNNDYKIGITEAYEIIALIYESKENYDECEKYFKKAFNISSEIDYIYGKIDLYLDFINFLENVGKITIAIEKIEEIYNISIVTNMYAKTMEICKRAIKLYQQANDTNNSNKYFNLYFEFEKKLGNIETENKARNLKTKVQLDALEKENKSILEKSEVFRIESEELIQIIKNISIISELGEKITTTLDLNQIYKMLNDTIQSFMKANTFGVGLYNNEKGTIEFHYLMENNVKIKKLEVNFDNESSMAVKCLRDNKMIVINDIRNDYLNYVDSINYIARNKDEYRLNLAIYCPLVIDNNLIGVMTVQANEKDSFNMLVIEMIKALSSYASIAINNAIKSMKLLVEVDQRRKVQLELEKTNNKLIYLKTMDLPVYQIEENLILG